MLINIDIEELHNSAQLIVQIVFQIVIVYNKNGPAKGIGAVMIAYIE